MTVAVVLVGLGGIGLPAHLPAIRRHLLAKLSASTASSPDLPAVR